MLCPNHQYGKLITPYILSPSMHAECHLFIRKSNITIFCQEIMLKVATMSPFALFQVGVGKSILQTLLGFFMFGGVTFHPVNVVGHVMNIMGGIGYTLLKYYSLCVAHALSVLDLQLSCLFQPTSMHTCVHVLKGAIFGRHHIFYFCSVLFLFVSPPCFEYCG